MATPFSQTLHALQDDNRSVYISVIIASILLAIGWGYWFVSMEMTTYQTSQKIKVSNKERLVTQFSNERNGVRRPILFRERKITAIFPATVSQKIQRSQPALVRFHNEKGRTVAIPAEVIEIIAEPNDSDNITVILNAQFDANIAPNPFEHRKIKDVQIETNRITPIDKALHASGLKIKTVPLTVSPQNGQ